MKRSAAVILAVAIAASGVVAAEGAKTSRPTKAAIAKKAKRAALAKRIKHAKELRLKEFSSCETYGAYMRDHLKDQVGPYGLYGGPFLEGDVLRAGAAPAASSAAPATDAKAPVAGTDYSTTNNQESEVDEADTVKTDGKTLFAIANGKLRAVDVSGGAAKSLGELALGDNGYGSQMLLSGSRILVIGYGASDITRPVPATTTASGRATTRFGWGFYRPTTKITLVDASNPSAMKVVESMTAEGSWIGARLSGGYVRLVVSSQPFGPEFVTPQADAQGNVSQAAVDAATARNKEIIANSQATDWLPRAATQQGATGEPKRENLFGCDDVSFPNVYSGESMLSVLTLDPNKGVTPIDRDVAVTDGQLIYASTKSLYVATPRWYDDAAQKQTFVPRNITTALHRFEIDGPTTTYRAAGQVPGYLLSQFAMSEQNGILRVASTSAPPWWGDGPREETQSYVTTLRETSGALVKAGQVAGLGKGERIYAVRFLGDTGYVVTFKQVDPLYTVDLSNPDAPKVVGELKITGYSAYLHPVGDGLLLGVGQEATPEGRRAGSQVSLFDVSDPANPKRIAQKLLGKSWSDAEWDHHAFLYWPKTGLTMLPLVTEESDPAKGTYSWSAKAVGLTVARSGITSAGEVVHPATNQGADPISRSVVVANTIYTLSARGLGASDLTTLARKDFLRFG